jgi:outer membrane protein OmpA-like peptidoglycan-associated protein
MRQGKAAMTKFTKKKKKVLGGFDEHKSQATAHDSLANSAKWLRKLDVKEN